MGPTPNLTEASFTGIALVIHDLATNALKHGAAPTADVRVILTWDIEEDVLRIEWREIDGPPVQEPDNRGFGLTLLSQGALPPPDSVELDFRPQGLVGTITARLDR